MTPPADAGMSVVELLLVLVVVAGVTAVAAAVIPNMAPAEGTTARQLLAFVRDTRLLAMRSGEPVLLDIDSNSARAGERELSLIGSGLKLLDGGRIVDSYLALITSDGIIRGGSLSIASEADALAVPATYRSFGE